jgi:ABC-type spermidine/putrescine transport system permease subunit II
MWQIFVPLCTPGFISAGIFSFTLSQTVGVIAKLIRGDVF